MIESVIISTLAGSVICTALLIFKNKILSILSGKALYYISLLAMLIFILPMNIGEISLPKAPIHQQVNVTEFNTKTKAEKTDNALIQTVRQEAQQETQHNVLPKPSKIVRRSNPITIQEILIAVWLLGFIILMCRYLISYFRFKKKICGFDTHEVIDGVDVIKSTIISSPLVFGFFKPTLAIPEIKMNEDDYNLAIKHEMVHYKHHDSWFKLFAVIVNSIYWFNPITYFMVNLIGEACEYACDEQVTKEMDMEQKPDVVIAATGVTPVVPKKIPGVMNENVVLAQDVLTGKVNTGDNCVVVGGGLVGAEVSNYLASLFKNVSVVEMRDGIALDEGPAPRKDLLNDMKNNGVKFYTETSVQEIRKDSVVVAGKNNEEIPADTVILAIGRVPNITLAESLKAEGLDVKVIGDAKEPALAGAAIRAGYLIGRHL